MFSKARTPTRAAVLAALTTTKGCTVRELGNDEYEVTHAGHTFAIGLNTEAFVRDASREVVASAGDGLPNREEVAAFDARFEIDFNGDSIADLFGPLLAIADKLAALTGGIGYECDNDAFQ